MLIIGSQALKHNNPTWVVQPKDTDIIGTFSEFQDYTKHADITKIKYSDDGNKVYFETNDNNIKLRYEWEIAHENSSGRELLQLVFGEHLYAPNHILLALKMSHRFKKNSVHFEKTRGDILRLRDICSIRDGSPLYRWMKRRESETIQKKHPKLNVDKGEFFANDGINYIYDHDSIHVSVARGKKPAYFSFLKDGEDVKCSKEKWDTLDEEIKLNAVMEESMALALERHQIPNEFRPSPHKSYKMALRSICTSVTSGWFREYAWENYDKALVYYNSDYVKDFRYDLDTGRIRDFK